MRTSLSHHLALSLAAASIPRATVIVCVEASMSEEMVAALKASFSAKDAVRTPIVILDSPPPDPLKLLPPLLPDCMVQPPSEEWTPAKESAYERAHRNEPFYRKFTRKGKRGKF